MDVLSFETKVELWSGQRGSQCHFLGCRISKSDKKSLIAVLLGVALVLSCTRTSSAVPIISSSNEEVVNNSETEQAVTSERSTEAVTTFSGIYNPCSGSDFNITGISERGLIEISKSVLRDIFNKLSIHRTIPSIIENQYNNSECSYFTTSLLTPNIRLPQLQAMPMAEAYWTEYKALVTHSVYLADMVSQHEKSPECPTQWSDGEELTKDLTRLLIYTKETLCLMRYVTQTLRYQVDFRSATQSGLESFQNADTEVCSRRAKNDCRTLKSTIFILSNLEDFFMWQSLGH